MAPAPPSTVPAACALVLAWLAGRDLSAAEVEQRLRRRGCPDDIIHGAVEHLRLTRAIDDERVAMSRARIESQLRGRGRERVLQRLRTSGIGAKIAGKAVEAVFRDVDEDALLERALARRLKPAGAPIRTPAEYRRLFASLLRQGFAPAAIRTLLDARRKTSADAWPTDGQEPADEQ